MCADQKQTLLPQRTPVRLAPLAQGRLRNTEGRSGPELDRVIKKPKALLPRICADERGSNAKVFTAKDAKERKESGIATIQNLHEPLRAAEQIPRQRTIIADAS
jgi:hypothetical protein